MAEPGPASLLVAAGSMVTNHFAVDSGTEGGGTRTGRIRVFLLDDHELVRRGLRDLLGDEPDIEVVGEAGTAAGAEQAILELRPDVAVLDARLPDGSGIEVCRQVARATRASPA